MQKQDDTFQTWHEHYRTEADETDIKVLDPKNLHLEVERGEEEEQLQPGSFSTQ